MRYAVNCNGNGEMTEENSIFLECLERRKHVLIRVTPMERTLLLL